MPDPRQERTREAIRSALLALLETEDLERISVTALTREAGLSRPTFYGHYQDVREILLDELTTFLEAEERAFEAALEGQRGKAAQRAMGPVFEAMAARVGRSGALFRHVFAGRAGSVATAEVHGFQMRVNHLYFATQDLPALPAEELDLIAAFCAGGMMALFARFLSEGQPLAPDHVARLAMQLVSGALHKAAARPPLDNRTPTDKR